MKRLMCIECGVYFAANTTVIDSKKNTIRCPFCGEWNYYQKRTRTVAPKNQETTAEFAEQLSNLEVFVRMFRPEQTA